MLKKVVSKAFCINLYYSTDRWGKASKQFASHGLNVERFNAIDGKEFKKQYTAPPGNCGCNLSHFLIIQTAFYMGLDAIMVFEDDVVLRENFTDMMDTCLADLPENWDLLMLAGSHKIKPTPVTDNIFKVNKSFCSHAYIMRSTVFELVLKRLKCFDQPLDCIFTELQQSHQVYVTNPPMVWQTAGFSIIEGRYMNYDHLQTNEQ